MEINTIEYFNVKVDMVKIDECLYIGEYEKGETYLVESIFSGDMFLDVCTDDEILLNYGVNVKEISYFN